MIAIVSGLPRSGTSLMMQMLAAGGMSIISDGARRADTDNPKGYLEWERVKKLSNDPGCIAEAEGKVVKVISELLVSLPPGHEYRVIFMQRPLAEVLASQEQMLKNRGNVADPGERGALVKAFQDHLFEINAWMNGRPNLRVLRVHYHQVLSEPDEISEKVAQFLSAALNVEAMAKQVDQTLYRQRAKQVP
jgi:hypothetical protein